jgi:RNA polymerase sigma-70 factor (ECF subfamily)
MTVLSEEERQIVVLHALSDMKHRQIAEVMGMPLPTVLSKYSRAMKKLRNRLQGDDL